MLKIQVNSPIPIYEQLTSEIKRMISGGELKIGESLPSIRNLASTLDVAANTVARAYNDLERAGYVESFGAKGTFVCDRMEKDDVNLENLSEILEILAGNGYSKASIHKLVEEYFENLNK